MKKRLSILLIIAMVAVLAFGLTGCGSSTDNKAATEKKELTAEEKSTVLKEAVENYYTTLQLQGDFANNKIAYKKVKEMVDKNDATIQIVDIRKDADYNKGHIKGAINIPYNNDLAKNLDKLDKGKTNIIVCYTGQTAGQTMALLRLLDYKALAMDKGMSGWTSQPDSGAANGYAVETN